MAITFYATNNFTGNGTTTIWNINFSDGYLDPAYVKARYVDNTGAFVDIPVTSVSGNVVNITPAVQSGRDFQIYRDTQKTEPLVDFVDGAILNENNLDTVSRQAVMVAAESSDLANYLSSAAITAQATATTALAQSNTAITVANTASANVAGAISAANTAVSTANTALITANAASTTANGIAGTANTALTTANAANGTANNALSVANGIAGTADDALDAAQAAVTTANAASATANGIAGTANAALDAATIASSDAADAVATANTALSTANGIAGTANTALSNSTAAVNTANSALAAVGSVGQPLAYTVYPSAGTFSHTFNTDARSIRIHVWGGGAGGAGINTSGQSTGTLCWGAAGGRGQWAIIYASLTRMTSKPTGATVVVGAAGAGGVASGAGAVAGAAGGSSSVTLVGGQAGAVVCPGGSAPPPVLQTASAPLGTMGEAGAGLVSRSGALASSTIASVDYESTTRGISSANVTIYNTAPTLNLNSNFMFTFRQVPAPFGSYPATPVANSNQANSSGNGMGGMGAVSMGGVATNRTGGAGTPGIVIIEEFS